ncbi:uncharacterized protein LOC123527394 [Mercenaria mercenaria]|uniref:uncharacterized protein LOC123527394 n=1 Tax=Mercenaria mercenaria TaxID=6596 RepID=UPI00234E5F29|nr:uncharacterized protein LOC123527394 [Mercenaria mercenaria]
MITETMKRIHVVLCFLLLTSWLSSTAGRQCPSCLHVNSNEDTPTIIRVALSTNPVLKMFNDTECVLDVTKRQSEIRMDTCEDMQGKLAQCGYYNGVVYLNISGIATSVPIKIIQRDCYYFARADAPPFGCRYRRNEKEDINLVQKTLELAASQVDNYLLKTVVVVKVEGDLCLNAESTSVETSTSISSMNEGSGVSKGVVLRCVLFVLFTFISI